MLMPRRRIKNTLILNIQNTVDLLRCHGDHKQYEVDQIRFYGNHYHIDVTQKMLHTRVCKPCQPNAVGILHINSLLFLDDVSRSYKFVGLS